MIQKKISIVIPCYNEEANLERISQEILHYMQNLTFEVIFVDDGSTDDSLPKIKKIIKQHPQFKFISFSRNFGHQAALRAGIVYSTGDCVISMDADLQHPPELILSLIEKWQNGSSIVSALRLPNKNESFFKKVTSQVYYSIINYIGNLDIQEGSSDFRLIDKQVAETIRNNPDLDLFLRGFISWLGFKQSYIVYTPSPRFSGTTKYSLKKMINLALSGITSFSIFPLVLSTYLGLVTSFGAFLYALYAIYVRFVTHRVIEGWTSVIISVLFIGGTILFILGIIGQYLGKIFFQIKGRPPYVIKDKSHV